jgi:acetyltransferase-like isoleucine patch superfamily enzyme
MVISIGNNVSISENVIISTADHDMDKAEMTGRNRGVAIEYYAWIGTRAIIMPDIKINFAALLLLVL